jgi:hypothetical protein
MRIPMQSMPVGSQLSQNANTNGVNASGLACTLCKAACSALSGPAKTACITACNLTVC